MITITCDSVEELKALFQTTRISAKEETALLQTAEQLKAARVALAQAIHHSQPQPGEHTP